MATTGLALHSAVGQAFGRLARFTRDEFRPWWDEDSRKTGPAVQAVGKIQ
jgi:hypothetical protein